MKNVTNKVNPIRILMTGLLFVIFSLQLSAEESTDSVFTFRFWKGDNRFFVPLYHNDVELSRLYDAVEMFKDKIASREISLYVNGYSLSGSNAAKDLAIAKIRSNRVKSELIVKKKLKEYNFVTRNHAEPGDMVTVQFFATEKGTPVSALWNAREESPEPEAQPETPVVEDQTMTTIVEPESESVIVEDDDAEQPDAEQPVPDEPEMKVKLNDRFALKTNLLFDAILLANIEGEWMFARRWSAALEWQCAWYAKESAPRKVYRIGTITPEVRYWPIERKQWQGMYVGVFAGGGIYDLGNSKKGYIGEGGFIGLSTGYMWPIGKRLSLEAGIGVGYLHIRNKDYVPRDGHFLYKLTRNINYFGPLRLKLSLVWRFQSERYRVIK